MHLSRKTGVVTSMALGVALMLGVGTLSTNSVAQEASGVTERKLKSKVSPIYPELARRSNLSGVVRMEVTVAPTGQVKTTKVIGGHPLLAGAAEDAVKKWKYEPGPETTLVIEFKFNPGA